VEAIALTLPSSAVNTSTLSSHATQQDSQHHYLSQMMRYDEHSLRELAFDLGVDTRALKAKLAQLFMGVGSVSDSQHASQIEKINNLNFNL
jgi:hypothetical protein